MQTELDQLAGEAAAVDQAAAALNTPADAGAAVAGGPGAAETPPPVDPVAEARAVVDIAADLAIPFYPALADVYTTEARQRLAVAIAALANQYGITAGTLFEKYKNWINLGLAAAPLALQTIQVVKAENAKKAAAAKKAEGAPPVHTESAPPIAPAVDHPNGFGSPGMYGGP